MSSISNNGKLPDFAFFIDKDIYLARQLERLGVRVFNSSKAIEISDDKIYTYQMLEKQQLPIPNTIIAPKKISCREPFFLLYTESNRLSRFSNDCEGNIWLLWRAGSFSS